ncbi:uncharacterized protein LOC143035133 isoform X1 [Oratosquilla oratoria]|uniref:uncharacterized protein LOC143035133 isoform X1 n=1 Tax=Oratosquilla oratoria TaxID=337810 RepID=UPI003F758F39
MCDCFSSILECLRSWLRQFKARILYRLDKLYARRARAKYLHREAKTRHFEQVIEEKYARRERNVLRSPSLFHEDETYINADLLFRPYGAPPTPGVGGGGPAGPEGEYFLAPHGGVDLSLPKDEAPPQRDDFRARRLRRGSQHHPRLLSINEDTEEEEKGEFEGGEGEGKRRGYSEEDMNEGMGVLSPHRLSQRLSENAAAREALGENDAELAQYLADERIALFLQNDEFMHELRTNSEFMRSLQRDYEEESEEGEPSPTSGGRMHLGGHIDDAALRERIANMGKASRKKFAHIAKVFSRRKRGARNLLPGVVGGPGGGRDQLLISSDPLIDDEEEDQTQKMCKPSSPRHGR